MTVEVTSKESVVYAGRIVEVVTRHVRADGEDLVFEWGRRPPGVRLLLYSPERDSYLCTREFRLEQGSTDLRLAGGKVFDTAADYQQASAGCGGEGLDDAVLEAARREAREELGIDLGQPRISSVSACGATLIWDLYFVAADCWTAVPGGPSLEAGESTIRPHWLARQDVLPAVLDGTIAEERSGVALLRHAATVDGRDRT